MKPLGEAMKERNIVLDTNDPVARFGFTQVPNFILNDPNLSMGAKLVYAKFLQYDWNNDGCYPGQQRMGEELGISKQRVSDFVSELKKKKFVTVKRRGLGLNNEYIVHFPVPKQSKK